MSPIERRVLAYLDQRGPTHRSRVVADLAPDDSRSAKHQNGSNGATPLIMGSWCRRLDKAGYVRARYDRDAFYVHHEITPKGSAALRALATPGLPAAEQEGGDRG
jgi:DNA-binding MarR family transcriptional regulator